MTTTTNLIPAFNEDRMENTLTKLRAYGNTGASYTPEGYKSTIIDIQHIVIRAIKRFSHDHVLNSFETKLAIEYLLLKSRHVPGKLGLIHDGSFCHFRLLIKPNQVVFTSCDKLDMYPKIQSLIDATNRDIIKIIDIAFEHAERIMITLDANPKLIGIHGEF